MQIIVALMLAVATVLVSGCHPSPSTSTAALPLPEPTGPVALSQVDLGASILAGVENALQAISLHDRIAAANDVGQALAFATQLPDQPSRLLPAEPITPAPAPPSDAAGIPDARPQARMTAFGAQVRLTSASAEIGSGNLQAAAADLHAIENGVPARLLPADLPLLRAAASLDLARDAAASGRTPELRTQLRCARLALDADAGGQVAAARALAVSIARTLGQPQRLATILPYQLSLWVGQVAEWAGSDRWDG